MGKCCSTSEDNIYTTTNQHNAEKPQNVLPQEDDSLIDDEKDINMDYTHSSKTLSQTESILRNYAFPKIGQDNNLQKHYDHIVEYFVQNKVNLCMLNDSCVTMSQFCIDIMQHIDNRDATSDFHGNYQLELDIRKLYMILQLYGHPNLENQPGVKAELETFHEYYCRSYEHCVCIRRMGNALKYCQTVALHNTSNIDAEKMADFLQQNYPLVLDDYIHIVIYHNSHKDLDFMSKTFIEHNGLSKCHATTCKCLVRYLRDRTKDIIHTNIDLNVLIYQDIMDQIHCYIFHLYDIGMKIKLKQSHLDNDDINVVSVDHVFKNLRDIRKEKRELNITGLDDYIKHSANKYDNNSYRYRNFDDKMTFIDSLFLVMEKFGCKKQVIINIKHMMQNEEYDSDSLIDDLRTDFAQGNIAKNCESINQYNMLKKCNWYLRLCSYTFSTGYRFYYWDKYKWPSSSSPQYGIYADYQLYVPVKYKSLKVEILNNQRFCLTFKQLSISLKKASKYIVSNKFKSLKSKSSTGLYYEIADNSSMTFQHFVALVLYTDWSDLCMVFTSTFHKQSLCESISSVKERNSEYGNWSKLLRECVELFGRKGYDGDITDETDQIWNMENNRMRGPFFCSASITLVIPEFNIRLYGPTSTSKQIEVTERFAGDNGIVIQLNNHGYDRSFELKAFSCSWLSNYNGEDEVLFIGGQYPIKIETVRLKSTKLNFAKFCGPLFCYQCLVTGIQFEYEQTTTENDSAIMQNLIKHNLEVDGFTNKYLKYINSTFACFVYHQLEIVFNLHNLNTEQKPFKHQLINENNIPKPIIFDLFINCQHMIIYATDPYGHTQYEFDLLSLLSLIKSKSSRIKLNNIQITIIGKWEFYEQLQRSWLYHKFSKSIKSQFQSNNYNIVIREHRYWKDDYRKEDRLIITPNF